MPCWNLSHARRVASASPTSQGDVILAFTRVVQRHMLTLVMLIAVVVIATTAQGQDTSMSERLMANKTVLITGSTDGLGREVAQRVAAMGAHVIIHGRNEERGAAVVRAITTSGKGSARFYAADLGSIAAVRAFAAALLRDYTRLDVLINNAGVLVPRGDARQLSCDGHEVHFAVNYLAGYILSHELRPLLQAAAPSRIINVASISQSPINFDDVMLERPGAVARGYGQSKLAQIIMTVDMAPDLAPMGISIVALHPATLMNTNMVTSGGMQARTTVNEGADAVMQLVTVSSVPTGTYYNGKQPATPNAQTQDVKARAKLRALSESLTGVP